MPPTTVKDKTIWDALLEFQSEGIELQKNAINPHFKNKYISLDSLMGQILPLLNKLEIVLLQQPTTLPNGDPALTTSLTFVPSGESIAETMPLILGKNDPQGQGAAITYARRYALMSILGLVADEDTDGQGVKPSASRRRSVVKRGAGDPGDSSFGNPSSSQIDSFLGTPGF